MKTLVVLLLWLQAAPQSGGAVSGVVRSADGIPLESAPVYAIPANAASTEVTRPREPLGYTDESGRYRIEVAVGRYRIASGPEDSLIYAPGVTDISAARSVSVTPGAILEAIDMTAGVFSGTIRQNGRPAVGTTVNAIPASMLESFARESRVVTADQGRAGWTSFLRLMSSGRTADMLQTFTDNDGRYRIEGVPTASYYIVAGWAEEPVFYPGTQTAAAAAAVPMTPLTARDGLDFEIPIEPAGVAVTGRLNTQWGNATDGIPLTLMRRPPEGFEFGLPSWTDLNAFAVSRADADGRFEFKNVRPGVYTAGVLIDGSPASSAELVVPNRPVENFVIEVPYALVSGRVLFEDGTPFWSPELFREIVLTSGDVERFLPIPPGGMLSWLIPPGKYRVSVGTAPSEYRIRLVTSDGRDLTTQSLDLTSKPAVRIEVRVTRK